MKDSTKGIIIFLAILTISAFTSAFIFSAVFFGTLTLIGLIVLVESIPPLKWLCSRMSRVLDILIFGFTIMAIAKYGLTIAASLTVAGLGYTLAYAPHLREQRKTKKKEPRPIGNYKSKFDAR